MSDLVMRVGVHTVPLEHASDTSALERLVSEGKLAVDDICAVLGKTEGAAFPYTSRAAILAALRRFIADHGSRGRNEIEQIPVILSAGGIGILTPALIVFTRTMVAGRRSPGASSLAIGCARTEPILPEWVGRRRMLEMVSAGVARAAEDAGVAPSNLTYVLTKSRGAYPADVAEARRRGVDLTPYPSEMVAPKTSGSAALATAHVIAGEPLPPDDLIGVDATRWNARVSSSCGAEDVETSIIGLANSVDATGPLRVGQATMTDFLDAASALRRAIRDAGLDIEDGPLPVTTRQRVVAVLAKTGIPADGRLRGRRQVIGPDNPHYTTEAKVAVAGILASELQNTMMYISSAGVHQAPPGGGSIAVIVDHSQD